jgi:class 3 adenylate cyclase
MKEGESGLAGLLDRWAAVIGNPLEWSNVDKTLLALGFWLAGYVCMFLWFYLALVRPELGPDYLSQGALPGALKLQFNFILVNAALIVVALGVRRRHPETLWPAYLLAVALSVHDAWFVCGIGHSTNPSTLLYLFLILFAGLLFFDFTFCVCAAATWAAVLGFHILWERAGVIPYAHLLNGPPFGPQGISKSWTSWNLGSGLVLVAVMIALLGYVVYRWREREAQVVEMSGLLKKMFGRYLSTEVMNSLIANPLSLELGGEKRRVTIMMTDLRGFTALSEPLDPEDVVQMLNTYFEIMVDEVLKYGGTINSIIGDALLVVFGAPQEMPDRARQAVACAIAMQNAMAEVNAQNREFGLPELEMGIGLNEAEVVVGNIGSSKRSQYSVIGRGVNMASRIESYTMGGQVLISESVRQEVGDTLRIDQVMEIMPKGAESPMTVYEVGGIGGRFNLVLADKVTELFPLAREIPVHYAVLDGKHVGEGGRTAAIISLSRKSALLRLERDISPGANLKLNLKGVSEELARRDFYGKAEHGGPEAPGLCLVRFSALPSGIDAYFQAALDLGARREVD